MQPISKIPGTFFTEIKNNSIWKHKIAQKTKAILRKNKARGITLSDFKLHYKAIKQYDTTQI